MLAAQPGDTTTMKNTPICYGYGRHSTNKQELTEEVQRYRCKDYFDRNLADRGYQWGGFFYDKATQGKVPFSERTQGRLVFTMARPGDALVVSKLDRSFRSLRDGIDVMEQLAARNVSFHSLDLLIDTTTPLGKFFRTILLAVAELERDFTSERVTETIAMRKREGLPHCRFAPVGWKIVGRKPHKEYRVDDEERRMVQAMAAGRTAGMSYEALAYWSVTQKQYPCKRTFPSREQVRWALNARLAGYPKVTNYKEFNRLVKSGEITLRKA